MSRTVFFVAIDNASGTLRRYRRKEKPAWFESTAEYTGDKAVLTPWRELPMRERFVSTAAIEAFRLGVMI